ncbi:MAG: hypothetical protein ACFFC7_20445 [Candidatus Hermodarchaeota archaeon]
MPFIKINAEEAIELLNDPSIITIWLKEGKINPKEADLLEYAAKKDYAQLKNLITENFGTDAEDAFERLSKFLETQSSVSWVLFSHTTQFIPFKEVNPLVGYIPREARVFIQETNEEMIEEGELGD